MKSFLILLSDKEEQLFSDGLVKDHIDYLKKLRRYGHLSLCGPFADNQNAMLVMRADSKDHAEKLINADPFIINKYYKKFVINEFIEAGEENNWLANLDKTVKLKANEKIENFLNCNRDKLQDQMKPLTMSVLFRRLKEGMTYADFRKAWLPPTPDISKYFDIPTLIINASNLQDASEIITVALIWANAEEATKSYQKHHATEEIRHKKLEKVIDEPAETRFCKIIDVDVLG